MSTVLNSDQQTAATKIKKFLSDPKSRGNVFTLTGGPGTGKTFMLREVVGEYKGNVRAVTVSHAAKNILQESLGAGISCSTISKSLSHAPTIKEDGTRKFAPKVLHKAAEELSSISVLIIDEVSQIDDTLYDELMSAAKLYGIKVIAVGDPYQLPPVEQDSDSKFFEKIDMTLTIPMRYQGPISKIAGIYKNQIDHINSGIGFEKWALNSGTARSDNFESNTGYGFSNNLDHIIDLAVADLKQHPTEASYMRILAYRNEAVAEVNRRVRKKLYGLTTAQFEPGEVVICNGGYSVMNPTKKVNNGELMTVGMHRVPVLYNGQILKVSTHRPVIGPYEIPCEDMEFTGRNTIFFDPVYTVSDTDVARQKYDEVRTKLQLDAMKQTNPRDKALAWVKYHEFIESFAYFDYAYSVNLYKAQGQTLNNVYVCEGEIMDVKPLTWKQKFQALYVAMTRAKEKLYIYNKEF